MSMFLEFLVVMYICAADIVI